MIINSDGPTRQNNDDTILKNLFCYRAAARTGRWEISLMYYARRDGSGDNGYTDYDPLGYVLHHADVSAVDYVRRAGNAGESHNDKEIVYIRDWVCITSPYRILVSLLFVSISLSFVVESSWQLDRYQCCARS